MEQKSLQHVTLQCKSAWLRTKPFRHSKPTYMYAKICIHATPQAPVSAQHELDIYITMILRRPLRTDADTDADPRGEVFGPRYDSNMLTLVGVYQYIYIHLSLSIAPLIFVEKASKTSDSPLGSSLGSSMRRYCAKTLSLVSRLKSFALELAKPWFLTGQPPKTTEEIESKTTVSNRTTTDNHFFNHLKVPRMNSDVPRSCSQ